MAKLLGLFRLGRDGDTKYLDNGTTVLELSLAYNYGKKVDGQQPTQWLRASMYGDRAEKVAEYMTKGKLIYAEVSDVHVRTWEKDGETKASLQGRLDHFEFAGGPRGDEAKADKPKASDPVDADSIPF